MASAAVKKTTCEEKSNSSKVDYTTVSAEQYFALSMYDWACNSDMEGGSSLNQQIRAAFGIVRLPQDASVASCWEALFKFGRVSVEEVTFQLKARQIKQFFCKQVRLHADGQTGVSPGIGPCSALLRTRGGRPNSALEDNLDFQNSCPLAPIDVPSDHLMRLTIRYNTYKEGVLKKALKMLELLPHLDGQPPKQLETYESAMRLIGGESYPIVVPKVAQDFLFDCFRKIADLEIQLHFPLDAADSINRARRYCSGEDEEAKKKLGELEAKAAAAWTSLQNPSSGAPAAAAPGAPLMVGCIAIPHESGQLERLEEISIPVGNKVASFFLGRRPRTCAFLNAATGREYAIVKAPTGRAVASGPNLFATRSVIDLRTGLAPLAFMHLDLGGMVIFRADVGAGCGPRAAEVKTLHEFMTHLMTLHAQRKAPTDQESLSRFFGSWIKTSSSSWN